MAVLEAIFYISVILNSWLIVWKMNHMIELKQYKNVLLEEQNEILRQTNK